MQYTKPELNVIGAAEGLVLGPPRGSAEGMPQNEQSPAAFEFEE
jgi:hypothetical protein